MENEEDSWRVTHKTSKMMLCPFPGARGTHSLQRGGGEQQRLMEEQCQESETQEPLR